MYLVRNPNCMDCSVLIIILFSTSGQAPSPDQTEAEIRDQEADILKLGEKYREEGKAIEMSGLIKQVRPILKNFSKAKAAKLVRGLVDMFLDIDRAEGSKGEAEVQLCQVETMLDSRHIALKEEAGLN